MHSCNKDLNTISHIFIKCALINTVTDIKFLNENKTGMLVLNDIHSRENI